LERASKEDLDGHGGIFMGPTITVVADVVRKTFADRLLPMLILGVIAAALFFTLVLGADASIGVGMRAPAIATVNREAARQAQ
jgi:hypothetical protein